MSHAMMGVGDGQNSFMYELIKIPSLKVNSLDMTVWW